MRQSAVVASTFLAGACAWIPVPDKPRLSVEPVVAFVQLSGNGRMETRLPDKTKKQNRATSLDSGLGLGDLDTAVGANIAYGDGFQGAEISFLHWEERRFDRPGILEDNFGALAPLDEIGSEATWNLWRLHYIAQVFEDGELIKPATLRAGVGLGLHHNEFRIESTKRNTPPARSQSISIDDGGIPMVRGRVEVEWKPFRFRIDTGIMAGDFGNVDGTITDVQATLHYRLQKGISAWIGYWHYDLPSKGGEDGVDFDLDIELNSWIAGVRFEF